MVLIGLLFNYFMVNFIRFPNHIIRVRKQDVMYIQTINFLYDYSEVKLTSSSIIDLSNIVNLSNYQYQLSDLILDRIQGLR